MGMATSVHSDLFWLRNLSWSVSQKWSHLRGKTNRITLHFWPSVLFPCLSPPALSNLRNALPASGSSFLLAVEHTLAEQFQSSVCSHLKTINKFHLQSKIVFKTVPLPVSLSISHLAFPFLHSTLFQKIHFVFYLIPCNWFCLPGGCLCGSNRVLSV